jgi:hypothetical protein
MNKKSIFLLILVIITAVVLLFNMRGMGNTISVDLVVYKITGIYKSIAFFGFTIIGVIIGVLLK